MSEKESREKLLLKVLRVADLLAKAETRLRSSIGAVRNSQKSDKSQETNVEHTKN